MTYAEACAKARIVWDNQPGAHIMSVQTCEDLANWLQANPTILAASPERNLLVGGLAPTGGSIGFPSMTAVTSWVKANPFPSLVIAFAVGYVLKD